MGYEILPDASFISNKKDRRLWTGNKCRWPKNADAAKRTLRSKYKLLDQQKLVVIGNYNW